jgi:hypothetical protein
MMSGGTSQQDRSRSRSRSEIIRPGALDVRELRAIALRMARHAAWDDLGDLRERSWRLFARTNEYDAWLIAWPSGGGIELHDHGESAGALVVVSGELLETRAVSSGDAGDMLLERHKLVPNGLPASFGRGEVHDVANAGQAPALSLHVYSPRLTHMTFYQATETELVATRTETVHDGEPERNTPYAASGTH